MRWFSFILLFTSSVYGADFSILNWNVGLLRFWGMDLVPHVKARAEFIPDLVEKTARAIDADIILLEEVFLRKTVNELRRRLQNDFHIYRPNENGPIRLGSGLFLAIRKSRWSFKSVRFSAFEQNAGTEWLVTKGFISATITSVATPGEEHNIIGTHMQCIETEDSEPKLVAQVIAHTQQTNQIRLSIARPQPYLIIGDLNVGPTLAGALFERTMVQWDAFSTGEAFTWLPQNPLIAAGFYSNDPQAQVDHCLTRRYKSVNVHSCQAMPLENLPDLNYPASDHCALWVALSAL